MQPVSSRLITCPQCGAQAKYSPENPWRPFCSERCKMIDLGTWAAEGYRIPDNQPPHPDQEES